MSDRLKELKRIFYNIRISELETLIKIEQEKPFCCNKWYCYLSALNKKNYERGGI